MAEASTKEILDALPPSDFATEQSALGAVFMRPDILDDMALIIGPSDFYDPRHVLMFDLLLEMHNGGKRIDSALFVVAARKKKILEGDPEKNDRVIGGSGYVAEIVRSCVTAANHAHYAKIIRELSIKRELRKAGVEIVQIGHDAGKDGSDGLSEAEQKIFGIRERRGTSASNATSIAEVLQDAMSGIDARADGTARCGLRTGFVDLDRIVGFRAGELLILAARPSMGKTALALNIASQLAKDEQKSVLFFSLEMSNLQAGERLLSSWSGVDGERMRAGVLTTAERHSIIEASADLSTSPLLIDDSHTISIQEIASVCRRQKRKHGLDFVVVDYLQLVKPDNKRDPREQQVALISKSLKALARDLSVPVLCLAQLNRQAEAAKDNRPRLSHLRESGAIEQDADVVAFVHRPEYYANTEAQKSELRGQAEIYIEKNRNGRTGMVKLVWRANIVTFENSSAREMDNFDQGLDQFNA